MRFVAGSPHTSARGLLGGSGRRTWRSRSRSRRRRRKRETCLNTVYPTQALAMLGDFIGKPVSMQVESTYGPEQYDIILL